MGRFPQRLFLGGALSVITLLNFSEKVSHCKAKCNFNVLCIKVMFYNYLKED